MGPVRHDHVVIKRFLDMFGKGKIAYIPREFTRLSIAFQYQGGSWHRLTLGSISDFVLLRNMVKQAIKLGYLTHTGKW